MSGRGRSRLPSSACWPGRLRGSSGGGPTPKRASRSATWPSRRAPGTSPSATPGPRCSPSPTRRRRFRSPRSIRLSPAPADTVEAVARRLHPEAHSAWAQFSLPEVLLLAERLCRDVRREALRHIPGSGRCGSVTCCGCSGRHERYGAAAQTGWRVGYGLWRLVRVVLNPLQAAGQETSGMFVEKTASVLSYRLRAYATRMLVLEVGRAAIDLYSGRLALSDGGGARRARARCGRSAPSRSRRCGSSWSARSTRGSRAW